jgi:hypothetical protein
MKDVIKVRWQAREILELKKVEMIFGRDILVLWKQKDRETQERGRVVPVISW